MLRVARLITVFDTATYKKFSSQKIVPSCGLSVTGAPNTVVALLLPTEILVLIVTLFAFTIKLDGLSVPVTTTLDENTVFPPEKVALLDTVRLPEIEVFDGIEPNIDFTVIFLLTGVPLGSSTKRRRSSSFGVANVVSCVTFLSSIF